MWRSTWRIHNHVWLNTHTHTHYTRALECENLWEMLINHFYSSLCSLSFSLLNESVEWQSICLQQTVRVNVIIVSFPAWSIFVISYSFIHSHTHTHSHQLPLAARCFYLKMSSYSHPPHADLIAHQNAVSTGKSSAIQREVADLLISSFQLFSFISPVRFCIAVQTPVVDSVWFNSWFRDVLVY